MRSYWSIVVTLMIVAGALIGQPAQAMDTQPNNPFPRVKMVTSMGEIVVELDRYKAPLTVKNFLDYVAIGSYDNTLFHRIIPDFVVQGGGFDPEFNAKPERAPIANEAGNGLSNQFGSIAMARSNDPHSATRQFYFNVADNDSLNPGKRWGYAVFGMVVEGHEVLQQMALVETTAFHELTGYADVPIAPVTLLRVEMVPLAPATAQ